MEGSGSRENRNSACSLKEEEASKPRVRDESRASARGPAQKVENNCERDVALEFPCGAKWWRNRSRKGKDAKKRCSSNMGTGRCKKVRGPKTKTTIRKMIADGGGEATRLRKGVCYDGQSKWRRNGLFVLEDGYIES